MGCECKDTAAVTVVRGNDFHLSVPVRMKAAGVESDFDLSAADSFEVCLVGAYKRYALEATLSGSSTAVARVEGDLLPCGVYGVEIKGRTGGSDWRSYKCGRIKVTECDCGADNAADLPLEIGDEAVIMGAVVAMEAEFADGYLTLRFPNIKASGDGD